MAGASNYIKPSSSKFTNWIKACLAVLITKEGLEPFVYDEIKVFQEKCLADICHYNRIPSGTICSSCCTENVVVCPTNRICNVGRGTCSYHEHVSKQYLPAGCPKKICHNLRTAIQNAHRYHGPSFKNTDATQWCTNPWEMAKCFMPPDGYKDVTSSAKTDFNGINSVIINYKEFQAKISDNLSSKSNIFAKGRTIGNAVRHSPSLEVEDAVLQNYVTDLHNLLSDSKLLAGNTDAQNARRKLTQLQNDTLDIDMTNFRLMLEDISNDVIHQIKEEQDDLKKKSEERKLELIKAMTDAVEKGKSLLSEITEGFTNAFFKLEKQTEVLIKGATDEIDIAVQIGKHKLQKEAVEIEKQIKRKKTTTSEQTEEETYNKLKKELKKDLADFNRNQHSTIPLSPLFEEKDTPLLDFYLMPGMNNVKMENEKEVKSAIQLLSEVYKSGNEFNKEIYVTADAGFGKTAFSKYLTVLWCQAHFQDEKHTKHLKEESVNAMREFQFIFLVLLRESSHDCSIDDLIFNHVVQNLSHSTSYNKQFLQNILHREKCLVVLDGLDEWTHPDTNCGKVPKSIPHRNAHVNCTILTTTRKWKLSITRLNTKQLDTKIELTHLDSKSALELTTRALKKLKGRSDLDMRKEAEELLDRYHDFEQVSEPLLLMYVICLWCDDIPLGQTKCGLYTSIIELLLFRTITKYKKFSQTEVPQCVRDLPHCFSKQKHCKAYFSFLTSLGELAFQTLFSENNENRLVFDSSIAEECLKDDFLELGRFTGIITQTEHTTYTSQISKTSFSHKTVQEFFAALYISTCSDQDKVLTKVLALCNSIQRILDLSKVFIFISGINAELFSLLSNKLMEVINKDEITSRYRSKAGPGYEHPLEEIQNMLVSCMTEIPDNKNVNICLQDFFFDKKCNQDNYYTSLQRLTVHNKTNIKSIYISEYICQSLSEIIDSCELSDPGIHCQKIYCECSCKEEEIISLLSTSVKCFYIEGIQGGDKSKDARSCLTDEQCKTFHNFSQLETIDIKNSMMSHKFLSYIIKVKSIKQITLAHLSWSDHDDDSCPMFNFDLSQHSELRKLVLSGDKSGNFTLCDMSKDDMNEDESLLLHNMRNIESVELSFVKMSNLFFCRLVEVIKQLEHSVRVRLEYCEITPREEFVNIRDDIGRSKSFDVETDRRIELDDVFVFVTKK